MKTTKFENTQRRFLSTLLGTSIILGALAVGHSARAQDDLLSESDSVLDSEQIDIDGRFKRPSEADRLNKMRKKLEKRNEDMVSKKIEDMRMKEEQKLSNKLRGAFAGNQEQEEDVVETQTASVQKSQAPLIVEEASGVEKTNKIITGGGLQRYQTDNVSLDSKLSFGVSVESMISERISLGLGLGYTTMDITNIPSNYYNFNNTYYYPTMYSGYNYGNSFGSFAETINYRNIGVEINSKFFIINYGKIRPYVGAAIGYNRTSLERRQNQGNNPYGNNTNTVLFQSNGKLSTSNINASALLGSEVAFGETWGLNVEVRYARNLTSNFDSMSQQQANTFNANDYSLRNIGREVEDADIMALNAGLLFRF